MFEFVVAVSILAGSESANGIFGKKSSSCSNGSCSVAPAADKQLEPATIKKPASFKEERAVTKSIYKPSVRFRKVFNLNRRSCN